MKSFILCMGGLLIGVFVGANETNQITPMPTSAMLPPSTNVPPLLIHAKKDWYRNAHFWANGWVGENETNLFYITDDGNLSINTGFLDRNEKRYYIGMDSNKFNMMKKLRESLPASEFTEGNWGIVGHSFQLSLRFEKLTFTNGEPVKAILLLRNVGDGSQIYSILPAGYSDGPIGFEVTSSGGVNILQHAYHMNTINGSVTADLFPGTQAKYLERLDKRFDLTDGTYSIQAVTRVGALMASPTIENGKVIWHPANPANMQTVKSAEVTIKIESFH